MLEYPTFTTIKGKRYDINTSYITAIECNEIALDENIPEYEKGLAIICKLFGADALDDRENLEELFNVAVKFLSCGIDENNNSKSIIDMDYVQDMPFIKASFRSDFSINLNEEKNMHWWEFYELLNGLSNSEFGNCCILNKIRNLRNTDTTKIKDNKLRKELEEAKEQFKLKRSIEIKKRKFTPKQEANIERFYKEAGIKRGD